MAQYFDFGEAAVPEPQQDLESLVNALSDGAAGAALSDGTGNGWVLYFHTTVIVRSIAIMHRPRSVPFPYSS